MKRVKKLLASAAIVAALSVAAGWSLGTPTIAGGETRTVALYHVHTKESISVTYMVKGRYVPSAMKKINYLMRDWRRNEVVTIDPETVDLMWELHADLGSPRPFTSSAAIVHPRQRLPEARWPQRCKKRQHRLARPSILFPDVETRRFAIAPSCGKLAA